MIYHNAKTTRIKGFSLVEMAIVIFIAGILLTAGLKLLSARVNSAQIETTSTNQLAIKQALIAYLAKNKRLPCPGDVATGIATTPPCNPTFGIVPYASLGLDLATVLDGWENYFTYVITPNPITPNPITAALPAKLPPYSTAWTFAFNPTNNISPFTNVAQNAFWQTNATGGILVSDGVINIADPMSVTGAVIALISHGRNGYGARNVKGAINDSTLAGVDENQNINPLVAAGNLRAIKRITTESAAAGGVFDDIVFTLNASDLITPLINSGIFGESSMQTLTKANDYILGAIIASKDCVSAAPECTYSIPNPTLIPTGMFENVISYAVSIPNISSTIPTNNLNTVYTITAGDGAVSVMTVGQLRGILARGSGFN